MADLDQTDAIAIAATLLEATGSALISGKFEDFGVHFLLPQVMTLEEETVEVTHTDQLRTIFENVHAYHMAMKVDVLHRYIASAAFVTETEIHSTHVSDVVSGGNRLKAPYPVFSILKLVDGSWKIASSDYAVSSNSGEGWAMKSAGGAKPKAASEPTQTPLPNGDKND